MRKERPFPSAALNSGRGGLYGEMDGARTPIDRPAAGVSADAREARMGGPGAQAHDEIDYAHRHFVNLAATALLLLLATLGVWTIKAIDDQEALRKCLGVGRKDCVKIAAPPTGVILPVR